MSNLHITVPAITRGHSWYARASPGKCSGFWDVFCVLGSVFGFWDVFLDSGKFFGFWDVFWILGRVLDSGKCFGTYELSRILAPYGDTKRRDTR